MKIKDSKWYYIAFIGITGGMIGFGYQYLLCDKIGWFYIIPMLIHAIIFGCIMGKLIGRLQAHEELEKEMEKKLKIIKDKIVNFSDQGSSVN